MKLLFDPNLSYQNDAIKSVTDLFIGQSKKEFYFDRDMAINDEIDIASLNTIPNDFDLSDKQLLYNIQEVQKRNQLRESEELKEKHFSIEMETGTGKTYVYLKTIYELNKLYGFKKFVIVVHSIAIREGVLKNLQITHAHFQEQYEKVPIHFRVYDSGKVSDLRDFAQNNNIEILVLGIDSFAKDTNIINIPRDQTGGIEPIKLIRDTRPMVIVDEPQNMETDKRKEAIASLNGLCTLRYSATHKHRYHLVYSLNPVQAYDLNLVKQIEVDSIRSIDAFNEAFIIVHRVETKKNRITAIASIDAEINGIIKKKKVRLQLHSDLYKESGSREIYQGYQVNGIDVRGQQITFSNGKMVEKGQDLGTISDHVRRQQIENTIKAHLEKEKQFRKGNQKIKVLSLFFIDKVAHYRSYEDQESSKGKYAQWFEEIYMKLVEKEKPLPNNFEMNAIHNGYFSKDNKGKLKDSKKGESKEDKETYSLIMKDKEKLLDPKHPLRFIFSHSALREGWDNPNVFQICTLNETSSEIKKRQEIGRGLRLCVNDHGERIRDPDINRLTIIANDFYHDFAKALQKEIEEDCGVSFVGRIKESRDRTQVHHRKGFYLDPRFLEIWDRIKQKTTYRVDYKSEELIEKSVNDVKEMDEIKEPSIIVQKRLITMDEQSGVDSRLSNIPTVKQLPITLTKIPNIIEEIEKKTNIKKTTIKTILKNSNRYQEIKNNPQLFIDNVSKIIKDNLEQLLVDGVKYRKIEGQEYEMSVFKTDELYAYRNDNDFNVRNRNKTIYDSWIPLDSNVENKFAKDCESAEEVKFYFKLPHGFKIPTPIGNYNPDWALIFENDDKIYFVAETKETSRGEVDESLLRPEEQKKIKYGRAHFKEFKDVKYQVTPNLETLSLNTP